MSTNALVDFRRNRLPHPIMERFPDARAALETLWKESREMREICRDYEEALASAEKLPASGASSPAQREELAALAGELEDELTALLARHAARKQA